MVLLASDHAAWLVLSHAVLALSRCRGPAWQPSARASV